MANTNNPHGLRPLGWNLGGGPPFIQYLSKLVGYGTAIFMFDAVFRVAGGSIDKSGTPGTTAYSGVAMNWGAASTATDHAVLVSPDTVYEAQDNAVSAGVVAANLGLNANLILSAGSATTKQSAHQINETGIAVSAALDVKLLKLLALPDNAFGPNARIEIVFNKHRMAPGVVGI